MVWKPSASAAALMTLAGLAGAQPAQAAASFALVPLSATIAASGAASRCDAPRIAPAGGIAGNALAPVTSKSAAILGGQVSALEMIARQQAGTPAPLAAPIAAAAIPGADLSPAAGAIPCAGFALPRTALPSFAPGTARAPLGAGDFLASKRLPVRRTSFDGAWNRVRNSGVSRGLARQLGALGGGRPDAATLTAVNSWTNAKIRYAEDRELYGQADYWASANTTLKRGAGDCEDIAIAKLQLLAAMGIDRSDMYLTIARDLARNADHAVLVVQLGGRSWMLDNATDQVLDASASYDYRPILSFSAGKKWLHGY